MAGYELGKAYINIVPRTDGLKRDLEKGFDGVGDRASKRVGGKLWSGLKKSAIGAGIAVGGILSGSVVKGFQRLTAIEDAEAKLRGLGNSAKDVESIMDNALAAVKGTAFGMDEAATTAASAVAAGIKPGKELESYLRLVGDAAAIAGTDMSSMGSIFNKVATSGKVQGDVFAQLGDAGIPIVTLLAEELGKSAEEVYKLGASGDIGTADFLAAMEAVGGSALEMGDTTSGAWRNLGAAMSRFGATLLSEVFPYVAPLLTRVTELFDYLGDKAGPAIERVMGSFKEWAQSDQVQSMLGGLMDVAGALYERVLKPLGIWIADNWKPIATVIGGIVGVFAGGAIVSAIGAAGAAIGGVVTVAGVVATAIGAAVGALTYFFTQTETGQKILNGLVSFVRDDLAPVIVGAFERVRDFVVDELWPTIKTRFQQVRDLAAEVWEGVVLPAFQQFSDYVQNTVMPIVQRLWTDYIQPAFSAIGDAAVWLWHEMIKPAWDAFAGFVESRLAPTLIWLWENVVSPVFKWIGSAISWAWENVIFPALDAIGNLITNVLAPTFVWLWETVKTVWSEIQKAVKAVVSWFQTWVWPVIELVIELVKLGFNTMRDVIKTVWANIRDNIIAPVVSWFRDTAWPVISTVIDSIKSGFNTMRDVLRTAWNTIRDNIIAPVANWFRDKIEPLFKRATDSTGSAFTSMKDSIKKAWDGIKNAAKAPVRFVVDTVINSALIGNFNKLAENLGTKKLPTVSLPSGFARGGILPGMSRMRDGDDQLVPMRRGEGVLVSEGLRTRADRAAFMAANAAGRRGIGFASLFGGGFAGGGIFDKVTDVGGHVLDKIKTGASWVMDALSDPKAAFSGLVDKVVGSVPGAGLLRDAAIGVPKKLAGAIADKVLGAFGPGSDSFVGDAPAGASRSLGYARQVASAYGLTMTSFRRPGARTAGSGSLSLHAQGRAMDFSNSSGPTPQMMAFFNAMHPLRPTELLYSPAGARQWRRGGYMANTSGATRRGHYNHVHVGFAEGGIFDQGGLMQPGMTGINLTRKPEAVLDPAQTRAYQAHAEAVARGDGEMTLSARSIEDLADALSMRPNVVQIGTRQAGQLALAGAGANRAMGGRL